MTLQAGNYQVSYRSSTGTATVHSAEETEGRKRTQTIQANFIGTHLDSSSRYTFTFTSKSTNEFRRMTFYGTYTTNFSKVTEVATAKILKNETGISIALEEAKDPGSHLRADRMILDSPTLSPNLPDSALSVRPLSLPDRRDRDMNGDGNCDRPYDRRDRNSDRYDYHGSYRKRDKDHFGYHGS